MPAFNNPIFSSADGFVSVELHDKHEPGALVLVRLPDPDGRRNAREVDRARVVTSAKEYLQAVINTLS